MSYHRVTSYLLDDGEGAVCTRYCMSIGLTRNRACRVAR